MPGQLTGKVALVTGGLQAVVVHEVRNSPDASAGAWRHCQYGINHGPGRFLESLRGI
jgi:hypothetical protein